MKLGQSTDKNGPGRRTQAMPEELLRYEGLWVDTFRGLRDGSPEFSKKVGIGSRIFIKSSGKGRQSTQITVPGMPPRIRKQPKFADTPEELHQWQRKVQEEEKLFESMTDATEYVVISAIPDERPLWEALKRARTAPQVRRICTGSKIWLKPRIEFPGGGFVEYWPWRRILYRDAEKFCMAKNDPRYPSRDSRESGDYRRVEYFARVMAGLTLRIAPSTSVDILRKLKHPAECYCWRCIAGIAPRLPMTLARFLSEGLWFEET